jgi:hypothetical protein
MGPEGRKGGGNKGMTVYMGGMFGRYLERKEAKKRMAIDYREEWKKLLKEHGDKGILGFGIAIRLGALMRNQIQNTISRREELMYEYMQERIIHTNIIGGNKDFHEVQVIDKRYHTVICTRSINKEDFAAWCKEKKERR